MLRGVMGTVDDSRGVLEGAVAVQNQHCPCELGVEIGRNLRYPFERAGESEQSPHCLFAEVEACHPRRG